MNNKIRSRSYLICPLFGALGDGIRKNGKEIRLTQQRNENMKNENEGLELNLIKGIISNISHTPISNKLLAYLTHIPFFNDCTTKYHIDQINFIYLAVGCSVHGIRKNGTKISLTQRRKKYEK